MKQIGHMMLVFIGVIAFSFLFPIEALARGNPVPMDSSWVIVDELTPDAKDHFNVVIEQLLASGKNKIFIKDGTYSLDNTLHITTSVQLIGESSTNTELVLQNTGADLIEIKDATNCILTDLKVNARDAQIGIASSHSSDIRIENCKVLGSNKNNAIAFYGKPTTDEIASVETADLDFGNVLIGNEIDSPLVGTGVKDGIYFAKQKDGKVSNNHLSGSRIAFYLSRQCEVSGNIVENSKTNGIRYSVPAYDNKITHNHITGTEASGIVVVRNDNGLTPVTYRASGLTIANNVISDTRYFGIELSHLMGAVIDNNTITNVDMSGIYLLYADGTIVTQNKITNVGQCVLRGNLWAWPEHLNSSIFGDYMVTNSQILNNELLHNASYDCPFGIRIQADDCNNHNQVTQNNITGYYTYATSARTGSPAFNIESPNNILIGVRPIPTSLHCDNVTLVENTSVLANPVVKDQMDSAMASGYTLKYTVLDSSVAEVDSSGKITAKNYQSGAVFTTLHIEVDGYPITKDIQIEVTQKPVPIVINQPPSVSDYHLTTSFQCTTSAAIVVVDPDGDSLNYQIVTSGAGIMVVTSGGALSYTPPTDFSGDDVFQVLVSDGKGGTVVSTITIMVMAAILPPSPPIIPIVPNPPTPITPLVPPNIPNPPTPPVTPNIPTPPTVLVPTDITNPTQPIIPNMPIATVEPSVQNPPTAIKQPSTSITAEALIPLVPTEPTTPLVPTNSLDFELPTSQKQPTNTSVVKVITLDESTAITQPKVANKTDITKDSQKSQNVKVEAPAVSKEQSVSKEKLVSKEQSVQVNVQEKVNVNVKVILGFTGMIGAGVLLRRYMKFKK